MDILADGNKVSEKKERRWRGLGMVSANGSSRLLMDYKAQHPAEYLQLLNLMFGKDGLNIAHLKLEMGSDVNSSSGTEPCILRHEEDFADPSRGAGFMLASDAKKVNPELTLDLLWWSEPAWISSSPDSLSKRYKWYRETLCSAWAVYGLKFDYVSATQNERAFDIQWIKYLSARLKAEKNAPYDFSAIKVVAGEEVCTWTTASAMMQDRELLEAVDVLGSHYTSWSTEEAQNTGKELWLSEGSSPMLCDEAGISGINGALDIATRIITMVSGGKMTLYEFQPVISSYYDGATYCQKQLITASEPWSGHFSLNAGFFITLHFSLFTEKNWLAAEKGCFGDGKAGGDGHAIVDSVYNALTLISPDRKDFTSVMVNASEKPVDYTISIKNLKLEKNVLNIWTSTSVTDAKNKEDKNKHWASDFLLHEVREISGNNEGTLTLTAPEHSIITVTSIEKPESLIEKYKALTEEKGPALSLPYTDSFNYSTDNQMFLKQRGNAPLFTNDEGGAFEVTEKNGKYILQQQITEDLRAKEWGFTPSPVTSFGDDRWYNYGFEAEVSFDRKAFEGEEENCWCGIGNRFILSDQGESGYVFLLYPSGKWVLKINHKALKKGRVKAEEKNILKLEAEGNKVRTFINGKKTAEVKFRTAFPSSGRAALYSSWHKNCFENLKAFPLSNLPVCAETVNNLNKAFSYSGNWTLNKMASFKYFRRTSAKAVKGSSFTFEFEGSGVYFTGTCRKAKVLVETESRQRKMIIRKADFRQILLEESYAENTAHAIRVTVLSGELELDAAGVFIK